MLRPSLRVLVLASVAVGVLPLAPAPAQALEPGLAFTSADLPTYQTNGVAWALASSQGLVFVGGTFTALRPPGAPVGSSEVGRTNFAVLDGATGEPTSCAPSFTMADPTQASEATVRTLDVSPDGATLYVGGYFNRADGQGLQHLAAMDIASCTVLTQFRPLPNGTVRAIDATADSVYYGGSLTAVADQPRSRAAAAAAVGTAAPGSLLPWAPTFDLDVRAIALKPDTSVAVVGGDFGVVNGQSAPALTVVDTQAGGTAHAYPPGLFGPKSVVKGIAVDGSGFYLAHEGTGFQLFDGRTAFDWDYSERWRDTCLGANQAVLVYERLLYSASHSHDCSTMGQFPDGPRLHFLAQSVEGPALLPWYPNTNEGIGEGIGPRALTVAETAAGDVLWGAGEFTRVNGAAQQGLTRFGKTAHTSGPSTPTMTVSSPRAGEVRVAWRQSFDTDDGTLTYRVYRDGSSTPVHTVTGNAPFWSRRQLTFTEAQPAGSVHRYRVSVSDGRNTRFSAEPSITVADGPSAYAERVAADGALLHWRYDEPNDVLRADATAADSNGTLLGGATLGVAGALQGDPSRAISLPGTAGTIFSEQVFPRPSAYSLETWFRTTTTRGGKIMGFGDKQVLPSRLYDKMIYMTNAGGLVFGAGSSSTVAAAGPYNDDRWHHVVATQGGSGMALYVDGVRVGTNTATSNQNYPGYLRVGGDNLSNGSWPSRPSSYHFAGALDETAYYPSALPPTTVAEHHALATSGAGTDTTPPTAPSALTATAADDAVTLQWQASEDAGGVAGYEVHRSSSSGFTPTTTTLVGSPTTPGFTEQGVAAGTWYYRVLAIDQQGNRSTPSSQASVVTTEPPPEGTSVTLSPVADTYANQGAPGSNFGSTSTLFSRGSLGYVSYLRFELPAAPAGTTLSEAVLQLSTTGDSSAGSADPHPVRMSEEGWTESGLTWNDRPQLTGDPLGTVQAPSSSTTVSTALDVTALAPLLGAPRSFGITSAGSDSLVVWSRNYGGTTARPQLRLSFTASEGSQPASQPPTAPTDLTATGSSSEVSLSWTASSDDVAVAGYEVHRSTSSGFTPQASTQVASVSGTATQHVDSGLAAGTWYYRLVAFDDDGARSAASSQASATTTGTQPAAEETTVTLSPVADTYANQGAPGSNFGSTSTLFSRGSLGYVSYLRFELPAAPAGTTLSEAVLQLRTTGTSSAGSADEHQIRSSDNTWTESGLTWNNRPALSSTVLGRIPAGSAPSSLLSAPLDAAALGQSSGAVTLGVTSTGTDSLVLWSRNYGDVSQRPVLVLTYR